MLVMDCSFIGVASKWSSQRALWGRELRVGGEEEEVHLHSPRPDNELIQLSSWRVRHRRITNTRLNSQTEVCKAPYSAFCNTNM